MQAFHEPLNSQRVYFSQEVQVKLYYRVLFLLQPHSMADLKEEVSLEGYVGCITPLGFHLGIQTWGEAVLNGETLPSQLRGKEWGWSFSCS